MVSFLRSCVATAVFLPFWGPLYAGDVSVDAAGLIESVCEGHERIRASRRGVRFSSILKVNRNAERIDTFWDGEDGRASLTESDWRAASGPPDWAESAYETISFGGRSGSSVHSTRRTVGDNRTIHSVFSDKFDFKTVKRENESHVALALAPSESVEYSQEYRGYSPVPMADGLVSVPFCQYLTFNLKSVATFQPEGQPDSAVGIIATTPDGTRVEVVLDAGRNYAILEDRWHSFSEAGDELTVTVRDYGDDPHSTVPQAVTSYDILDGRRVVHTVSELTGVEEVPPNSAEFELAGYGLVYEKRRQGRPWVFVLLGVLALTLGSVAWFRRPNGS